MGAGRRDLRGPDEPPADQPEELVWWAPRWVLPVGTVLLAGLVAGCAALFRATMHTALRESVTEAFGVGTGLLVLLSGIGAFHRAALERRDAVFGAGREVEIGAEVDAGVDAADSTGR